MRIIFFGTSDFVLPVLQKLQENFEVVKVVNAQETLDQEFINELRTLDPELFVVASYGKIIPQSILDIPKYGSLNIHPSLLPKYRGPSPIQSAILNGDKISGVSILVVDDKMDHGPIVATEEVSLSNTDTFDSLSKKMFLIGAELLVKIIPDYVGNKIKLVVQDDAIATYCNMIKKENGYFDLNNLPTHEQLDKMIRAFYPWPTAWTRWNDKIVKFLPEGMVQMEGKKPAKLEAFLHGYPTFPIKIL